jgi:CheY-like chemotaxis protein
MTMPNLKIFLAEDNAADVLLLREAFDRVGWICELQVVEDGQAAASILDQLGREAPCPDIIIIDLNLPKVDGMELLRRKQLNPGCEGVPALVMTSSKSPSDLKMIASLGAAYFHKPIQLSEYLTIVDVVTSLVKKSAAKQSG